MSDNLTEPGRPLRLVQPCTASVRARKQATCVYLYLYYPLVSSFRTYNPVIVKYESTFQVIFLLPIVSTVTVCNVCSLNCRMKPAGRKCVRRGISKQRCWMMFLHMIRLDQSALSSCQFDLFGSYSMLERRMQLRCFACTQEVHRFSTCSASSWQRCATVQYQALLRASQAAHGSRCLL